jgi:hypothetical protein
MTNITRSLRRALLLVPVTVASGFVPTVSAQPSTSLPGDPQSSTSGPVVVLDGDEFAVGDDLVMTMTGFEAASYVTIAVCGNQARRGSADCNMIASQGVRLNGDDAPTLAQMSVAAPPVPCPCIIRVSSQSFDEVAIAPIALVGHPSGPLVGGPSPNDPLVAVTISARAAPHGAIEWARSSLGGPTTYEVTVTVKNLTTEVLRRVAVSASVGRGADDSVARIALGGPGEIGPAQTRREVVSVEVPAPTFGGVTWRVAASGAGPAVNATKVTHHRPTLLIVLVTALVLDLMFLVVRSWRRRRAARHAQRVDDEHNDGVLDDRDPDEAQDSPGKSLVGI